MSAVEWAKFGLDAFGLILGLALQVFMLLFFYHMLKGVWGFFSEGRHELPSLQVLLRRVYCRHRSISMVRTRYMYRERRCTSCGIKIDHNKKEWLRR